MEKLTIIIRTKADRARAVEAVKVLAGEPLAKVVISEHKETRSGAQRRLQWFLYKEVSIFIEDCKGKSLPPGAIHVFFTEMFQKTESFEGPDGKYITRIKSTSDNDTKEMHDYLEKIYMYSSREWGCVLPVPDEFKGAFVAGQTIKIFNGSEV